MSRARVSAVLFALLFVLLSFAPHKTNADATANDSAVPHRDPCRVLWDALHSWPVALLYAAAYILLLAMRHTDVFRASRSNPTVKREESVELADGADVHDANTHNHTESGPASDVGGMMAQRHRSVYASDSARRTLPADEWSHVATFLQPSEVATLVTAVQGNRRLHTLAHPTHPMWATLLIRDAPHHKRWLARLQDRGRATRDAYFSFHRAVHKVWEETAVLDSLMWTLGVASVLSWRSASLLAAVFCSSFILPFNTRPQAPSRRSTSESKFDPELHVQTYSLTEGPGSPHTQLASLLFGRLLLLPCLMEICVLLLPWVHIVMGRLVLLIVLLFFSSKLKFDSDHLFTDIFTAFSGDVSFAIHLDALVLAVPCAFAITTVLFAYFSDLQNLSEIPSPRLHRPLVKWTLRLLATLVVCTAAFLSLVQLGSLCVRLLRGFLGCLLTGESAATALGSLGAAGCLIGLAAAVFLMARLRRRSTHATGTEVPDVTTSTAFAIHGPVLYSLDAPRIAVGPDRTSRLLVKMKPRRHTGTSLPLSAQLAQLVFGRPIPKQVRLSKPTLSVHITRGSNTLFQFNLQPTAESWPPRSGLPVVDIAVSPLGSPGDAADISAGRDAAGPDSSGGVRLRFTPVKEATSSLEAAAFELQGEGDSTVVTLSDARRAIGILFNLTIPAIPPPPPPPAGQNQRQPERVVCKVAFCCDVYTSLDAGQGGGGRLGQLRQEWEVKLGAEAQTA